MQIRSSLWEDGLAQEDDAVGRRGGVDGRETWHGICNSTTLKMDWWQLAAVASESAPDRCVPHIRQVAWLRPHVLDVRLGCDVCLVLGPGYLRAFINWIGVATFVA